MVAVDSGRLLDLSLGYFLFPLVVAPLGALILKEKLGRPQLLAIALASVGVLIKLIQHRSLPLLALALAFSFSLYSLLKRRIGIEAVEAIFLESLCLLPLGLGYAAYAEWSGAGYFLRADLASMALLVGGGILTALTLVLFAAGAGRVSLFTVGFLQYISPTMVLLLGLLVYGEEIGTVDWLLFGFIWAGLFVASLPAIAAARRNQAAALRS
jgi:chloramphenicol-sensitive protein RarD